MYLYVRVCTRVRACRAMDFPVVHDINIVVGRRRLGDSLSVACGFAFGGSRHGTDRAPPSRAGWGSSGLDRLTRLGSCQRYTSGCSDSRARFSRARRTGRPMPSRRRWSCCVRLAKNTCSSLAVTWGTGGTKFNLIMHRITHPDTFAKIQSLCA